MRTNDIISEDDGITVRNPRKLLRVHPEAIIHMHNPSDDLILYALRNSEFPEDILSRIKLSPAIMGKLLKSNPDYIAYVRNPSEEMWLEVIRQEPDLIDDAKKQTPAMQMLAYSIDPRSMRFIRKPTPELVKLAAENGHTMYLAHAIEITDPKTQLDAVKHNTNAARQMRNMKPMAFKWLLRNNETNVMVDVVSNIPIETIEQSKDELIKFMLRCIKTPDRMYTPYQYPNMRSFLYANKHSLIKWLEARGVRWPEIDIIKKSLKVMKARDLGENS